MDFILATVVTVLLAQGKKVIEDLGHKKLQATLINDTFLNRFFTTDIERAFEKAFLDITGDGKPNKWKNKGIRRRFLRAFFKEPDIDKHIEAINNKSVVPVASDFYSVFRELKLFPANQLEQSVDQFIAALHHEFCRDQQLVNRVTLSLPEELAEIKRMLAEMATKSVPGEKRFFALEKPANYIDRPHLTGQLKAHLLAHPGEVAVVSSKTLGVYGMPGVGKTLLATDFAHLPEVQATFEHIYYQFCGENSLHAIINKLAVKLTLDISDMPPDTARQAVKHALSEQRTLLILDDVKQETINDLLPGGQVSVIITTRNQGLRFLKSRHLINVEQFTPGESLALFTRVLGDRLTGHEAEAAQLADKLGHLPIAIVPWLPGCYGMTSAGRLPGSWNCWTVSFPWRNWNMAISMSTNCC